MTTPPNVRLRIGSEVKICYPWRFFRVLTGGSLYIFAIIAAYNFVKGCATDNYMDQPLWYFGTLFAVLIGSVVLP